MARPGYRSMTARPTRPTPPERDALVVDYADVLEQAVANQRWQTLREVLALVEHTPTTEPSSTYTYRSEGRRANDVKSDILAGLNRMLAS